MTGRYTLRYLAPAQQDLLDILDYIAQDNPEAARAFVERVERSIGSLARFPRTGRRPRDQRLQRQGYPVLVVGDYLAFYVLRGRVVEIRRVLHGARGTSSCWAANSIRPVLATGARKGLRESECSRRCGGRRT